MTDDAGGNLYRPYYFARQPIFTREMAVFGFELLYRHSAEAESAQYSDEELATLNVAAGASITPLSEHDAGKAIVMNFTRHSVLEGVPLTFQGQPVVIKTEEPERLDGVYLLALQSLKAAGLRLALDAYTGRAALEPLYELADILVVDVLDKKPRALEELVRKARFYRFPLLATRVEDRRHFKLAKDMGFLYFQGFFFQEPEIVPGRTLTSNETSRLHIFRHLERDEPEFDTLAEIVRTDVSISYRLLAYLNSAAFCFPESIHSIKQAIIILGWTRVRNWLKVIILTDLAPSTKTSELPYLSAVRGRFLESLAQLAGSGNPEPSELFLLGLFSLLDAMLDLPMAEIVGKLPLPAPLAAALHGDNPELTRWLEIALCFENGDWERLDSLCRTLALDTFHVARTYYDALVWANAFFGSWH